MLRRSRALSQAELAERCGLSRQYMNLVESGRTLPNVQTALNLADELGCSVEELFRAVRPARRQSIEVYVAGKKKPASLRLQVARIGERWVGHSADTGVSLGAGFASADAVVIKGGKPAWAELLRPMSDVEQNIGIAGCDPALSLLQRTVRGQAGNCFWVNCGSGTALAMLADGWVHAAGLHYSGKDGLENLRYIQGFDPLGDWRVFRFTHWEQGWLLRPEAKDQFENVGDLGARALRLANREPGAASRVWLDKQIKAAGLSAPRIKGYEIECRTHWECARMLVEGKADVAVGPRAVADIFGLDFIPTALVAFDIVVPKEYLDLPRMQALMQVLRGHDLQQDLASLPGYDSADAGYAVERPAPEGALK